MRFDWSSLFLFSSIVSSVIGLIYLCYSYNTVTKTKSIPWLALVLVTIGIVLLEYIIRNSDLVNQLPHFLFIGTPAFFILLPAVYVYQKQIMSTPLQAGLHFIIPGLVILLMLPTYLMHADDKVAMFTTPGITDPVWIICAYLTYFCFYQYHIFKNNAEYRKTLNRELSSNTVEWDQISSKIVSMVSLTALAIPFILSIQYLPISESTSVGLAKAATLAFSFAGHFVLVSLMLRRNWEHPFVSRDIRVPDEQEHVLKKNELDAVMQSQKYYLDNNLTLDSLANRIGWSRTLLSGIINRGFNENFYDYINKYRLLALEEKLRSGAHLTYSLDHLVKECGFTNYVTFYRFFKRKTGKSPSAFIKSLAPAAK